MDNSRRTTRGRFKKSSETPTNRTRTSIPVAGAVGIKKSDATSSDSSVSGRTSSRLTRNSPSRRASPARKRTSPLRRSSRPRSTNPTAQPVSIDTAKTSSTIKEENEANVSHTNLPLTLTTNTSTRAPGKITTTTSTQSSTHSKTTQQTVEVRTSTSNINKLSGLIRRSVSKTFSSGDGDIPKSTENRDGSFTPSQHTEGESRYSRSVSHSVYDGYDRYSKAEFSDSELNDRDDVIAEENESIAYEEHENFKSFTSNALFQPSTCRKLPVPKEFGGFYGISLLLIFIPSLVYYLHWCCLSKDCDFKLPNFQGTLEKNYWLNNVFNGQAAGSYLAFNFGIFVLSALLFGRYVRLPGTVEYKFNALPITIICLLAFCVAEYYKIQVANFILDNYLRFCIYGLLNAYVVAFWAYIRSDILKQKDSAVYNVYAKSGNILVDYALGRQLNPKWLGLVEFKLVFYKVYLISTFLYAVSIIRNSAYFELLPKEAVTFLPFSFSTEKATFLCAFCLLVYILDSIIFEHQLASSFELQGEGFGCLLLLRYAATPYLVSAVAKYFYDHPVRLTCIFTLYVPLIVVLLGLVLKRLSNATKYLYRLEPNHGYFADTETIHTFQGKRLLLGTFWGRLRQPNYLGDIIAIIGLTLPLVSSFAWPPLICLSLIVVLLVHRCLRVNARNTARYHSSWVRYRNIARNYLLPKVF